MDNDCIQLTKKLLDFFTLWAKLSLKRNTRKKRQIKEYKKYFELANDIISEKYFNEIFSDIINKMIEFTNLIKLI